MSNLSISFFIEIVLIFAILPTIVRMLIIGNRDEYLGKHKYKTGSPEHEKVLQLTSRRFRIGVGIAALIILLATIATAYLLISQYGRSGVTQIEITLGFIILIAIVGAAILFAVFKDQIKRQL